MNNETNELKKRIESKIKRNFVISYYNTEENQQIINTFKLLCEKETDNHYLLGLKKLIETYSTDWKYELISYEIQTIKEELAKIKNNNPQQLMDTKNKIKTFGGKQE